MNPSVVAGDHADVHLERAVVRWLAELVGFPHAPGAGLLTSGASAATIVCLAGARGRALAKAGHDVRRDGLAGAPRLVAYVPAEAHSCVQRALELLGLGSRAMREVPLDGGRLDATALRAAIAADRASGALPALLVGSAGTVNSGAIDPLDALADVAAAEDLWFHVDGAYGAFGVLDPAIAARYRGMDQADSLVLDPHKWLGVPVDAGCALVRRGDDLRDAFSLIPPYLRQDTDAAVGTFAEYGPEQTRPFRALKTWATIAARGRAGIAAQVARANALARELAALIEREPELELAAAPVTSIVAFRARPAGCPPGRLDELNRALPGGGPGARPRLRHRHRLRRPRDAARLHPAPRHELGAPRDARRRSRRDGPQPGRGARIRGDRVISCREAPTGSAHQVKGHDRRGPPSPGDHHAEVPAPQALPRRPGAAPSLPPDGPVGPRGRGGALRLPQARQRAAGGERRVRRRAGAHAGAHLGALRRPGCRTGHHRRPAPRDQRPDRRLVHDRRRVARARGRDRGPHLLRARPGRGADATSGSTSGRSCPGRPRPTDPA